MSKLHFFKLFISVGNLKPKLKWVLKLNLKPKMFLLNWAPAPQVQRRRARCNRVPHRTRRQPQPRECNGTVWDGNLLRRFCIMFSESGQHGRCSTAQGPGELSENIQNIRNQLPPHTVFVWYTGGAEAFGRSVSVGS